MTDDKLLESVQSIVDNIFKSREETDIRAQTEQALQKSTDIINELKASLEAKDADIAEMVTEMESLKESLQAKESEAAAWEEQKEAFESEKATLLAEKEDLSGQIAELSTTLEDIKKDAAAAARFEELKSAGVAASSEVASKDQLTKIREMSDEDFESYKQELSAIRESIIAGLNSSHDTADNTSTEDNAEEQIAASADVGDEEEEESLETPIHAAQAAHASLNFEVVPGKDIKEKYAALGHALAARSVKK